MRRQGGRGGEKRFIAQAVADWGEDAFAGWPAEDLAALAYDLWSFGQTAGEEPLIRLLKAPGPSPVDLLEIVQDDAPFLVDSVMGEIAADGFRGSGDGSPGGRDRIAQAVR